MKSSVGAFRRAFARKHAGRVFPFPSIGIDAGGVGVTSRQILAHQKAQQIAPVTVSRRRDLWNLQTAE